MGAPRLTGRRTLRLVCLLVTLAIGGWSQTIDFESPVQVEPAGDAGAREAVQVQVVSAPDAPSGKHCLALDYDHSSYLYGMAYLHVKLAGQSNSVSFWLKGDGSDGMLTLRLSEADWDAWETPAVFLDFTGWRKFTFKRSECCYNAWGNGLPQWDSIQVVAFMPRRRSLQCLVDDLSFFEDASLPPEDAQGKQVPVKVDFSKVQGRLFKFLCGFSQGGESNDPHFLEPITTRLAKLRPQLNRADHLFDYFDPYQGPGKYDFSRLDGFLQPVFDCGAKPLMSLSYSPKLLIRPGHSRDEAPKDFQQWAELVAATVRHYNVERKVGVKYWELWNEPFGIGHFKLEDYLELYKYTAKAVKQVDPTALVGGPALAGHPEHYVAEFLDYCKREHLPVDFLSYHDYKCLPESYAAIARNLRHITDHILGPNHVQLIMDEWNADAGLNTTRNDTNYDAAYLVDVLYRLQHSPLDGECFFEPKDSPGPGGKEWWGAGGCSPTRITRRRVTSPGCWCVNSTAPRSRRPVRRGRSAYWPARAHPASCVCSCGISTTRAKAPPRQCGCTCWELRQGALST